MAKLLLIRHGQASYGADDYDQLSELGEQQAALLGRWFAECDLRPARIVIGAMKRHRQTAEHCLAALGAERAPPADTWITDPRLNEYDNEHILRIHRPDLADPAAVRAHMQTLPDPLRASREMFFASMLQWTQHAEPGTYDELWSDFHGRGLAALLSAAEGLASDAPVLVFTSGGLISGVLHRLLQIEPALAFELNWTLANTGITVVNERKGRLRLLSMNGTGHFENARRTDWITYR